MYNSDCKIPSELYLLYNDIVHSSSAGNTVTMHSMREQFAMTMWNEVQEMKCATAFSLTAKTFLT